MAAMWWARSSTPTIKLRRVSVWVMPSLPYTAVFSSVGAAASSKSGVDFNWLWLLLPVGAAALGGCGYAGYKGYRHYINKKRGYAA